MDSGNNPLNKLLTKLALEHSNRAGAADVVRHQQVGVHPNIVIGVHLGFARCPGQYFFSQRHYSRDIISVSRPSRNRGLVRLAKYLV